MKYQAPSSSLFKKNRSRFIEQLLPGSIAIFPANDHMPLNADGHHRWKQSSDLFWLSGIDQEETILVLFPDCPNERMREALFLRKTNEQIAMWEGHKYTKEEAAAASGIDIRNIYWVDDFDALFRPAMNLATHCYLNLNEHDRAVIRTEYAELRWARRIMADYPLHEYHRAAPILHRLRSIKTEEELALLKEAIAIVEKGFRRLLKFVKPGVWEYEVEAELIHEYIRNRATGHSFEPIIASGPSACVLHYVTNNKQCMDGHLLLVDTGVEYGNYCSDLTRVIPVNGKFSPRQRDVYNAVLRVQRAAMAMLVPGNTLVNYHMEVGKCMEQELIGLGLLNADAVKNQNPDAPLYKKYFAHGTSHYLGLDVHDVGMRWAPFEAGMVYTCEPGIYIPEEGIGIRIENDVLITENGPVDLMAGFPIEVDEIEALMRG